MSPAKRTRKAHHQGIQSRLRPELAYSAGDDTIKIRVCAGPPATHPGARRAQGARQGTRRARPLRHGRRRRDRLSRLLRGGPHRGRPPAGPVLPAPQGQGHRGDRRDECGRRRHRRPPAVQGPGHRRADRARDRHAVLRWQERVVLARQRHDRPYVDRRLLLPRRLRALAKVLEDGDPEAVIDEVETRGLRGRGGAGFPTGTQVALLPRQPGRRCTTSSQRRRGRPRRVHGPGDARGQPSHVVEGMLIAATPSAPEAGRATSTSATSTRSPCSACARR